MSEVTEEVRTGEEEEDLGSPPSDETGVEESESPSDADGELHKSPKEYEKEIEGLIAAKQAETQRRQQTELYLQNVMRDLEDIKQKSVKEETYDDEETLFTRRDVSKIVNDELAKARKSDQERFMALSVEIAAMRHPDYFDVIKFLPEITQNEPGAENYILNSPNPAERAYNLALTHPEIMKKKSQEDARKVVNQLKKPAPTTTLSDTGAGTTGEKGEIKRVRNLSDEDILKELRKRKGLE